MLKSDQEINDIRIVHDDKWLFYEPFNGGNWIVYQRKYRSRTLLTLYYGKNEEKAVEALINQ